MMYEAEKYYANILNSFSPMVMRKLKEIMAMNLPLSMICPSHGVIWRKNPSQIVEQYLKWADAYRENQVTIAYDSMWNSTRLMAEAIAQGIKEASPLTTVKLFNAAKEDKNDILTEMFRSKAILVGSPTINSACSFAISGLLEMMKGLKLKNKKAAAFGSYGWSGEGNKIIGSRLAEGGLELVDEGLRLLWVPDEGALEACKEYGKAFAKKL
jgi:flavorubredoxin